MELRKGLSAGEQQRFDSLARVMSLILEVRTYKGAERKVGTEIPRQIQQSHCFTE